MATTHTLNIEKQTNTSLSWLSKRAFNFENARFFWMAVYITSQSMLGSVACMYILKNEGSDIMLATSAMITMGCNAILIAQGPSKWCVMSFYISMVLNALFIILNFN